MVRTKQESSAQILEMIRDDAVLASYMHATAHSW